MASWKGHFAVEREGHPVELPPLLLDRSDGAPLAVQLADAVRAAAATGTFRRGDRLPSTRALAATLGVSRTVTAAAYDQLLAEGWIAARHGAGTFVVGVPGGRRGPAVPASAAPRSREAATIDLEPGAPCREALDPAAWRRAWRAGADEPAAVLPDNVGLPAYRAAVADQLLRHRGLTADPHAVLATSGTTAAVAELAALLPEGARVVVEEPGYQRAAAALRAAGAQVLPVPVDGDGLVVDVLPDGLAAVYCTPAHQYPVGARLSARRRLALVERARAGGFLVVEDDYDGELRYDVAPLPLLAALAPDVVAHLGTTSKVLTPTLGVGWMVAPPAVRDAVVAARAAAGPRPAEAGQRVFAALAAHGDLPRHLRRLRRVLGERRAETVAAIRAAGCAVRGDAAGGHVVVPLPDAERETAVIAELAGRGVAVGGLTRYFAGHAAAHGIVVGYAGAERADLRSGLAELATALSRASGTPARPG